MNFTSDVISWYQAHKRDLPWRNTQDPYIIWLSEVILQQTRVDQGMPYFFRFSEKYPTVSDFAAAGEDEILKMWQGLGYYSRGRNMHHTANMVMEEHAGYFPSRYDQLIRLKGIGEYTAAAIASFSQNEAKAVVDGNVFRLLSRYFGIDTPINSGNGKKTFTELANELMDKDHPGLFNQAMMEFGALQCTPRNPDCPSCPLRPGCEAFRQERVNELPVKIRSGKTRVRYFNYIVAIKDGKILMNKRGAGDIWQNLYELPLLETAGPVVPQELILTVEFEQMFGKEVVTADSFGPVTHILSHQKLFARFIRIANYNEQFTEYTTWSYVDFDDLEKIAQPKLIFAFLKNYTDIHSN